MVNKPIIYQVFTRLFGNDRGVNQPNGDLTVNGCGTMADFTPEALAQIKALGATHVWYTGIIEHATQTDYTAYGIRRDHRAIVKGKAGSVYAIKDYFDIDPDLATSVPARMKEFTALVDRTHRARLNVIIDFVPNHVARQYHSDVRLETDGLEDLGATEDTSVHFSPQNNFYYFPGERLHTDFDLQQGEESPYVEEPARATGNDVFSAYANHNDWYETVKLNYGVDYTAGRVTHFDPRPSTWYKMLNILLFWCNKGVDGFRCDMAEMVPVEFWDWAISRVKVKYPNVIFIAEVYNPAEYRRYVHEGHFDYLYDKVGLYDTLRAVTCGYANATAITQCWQSVDDIRPQMLSFLENHDEQRLASEFYAADPLKGRAPMLVAATISTGPVMLYFGQELGERGMDAEGFSGRDGRTTIFDYWTVDTISRWRNRGRFDGKKLTPQEVELQSYYSTLLNLCSNESAIEQGEFYDLMYVNPPSDNFNPHKQFAYLRHIDRTTLLIVANFDSEPVHVAVNIPQHAFRLYRMNKRRKIRAIDLLTNNAVATSFSPDVPSHIDLPAYGGVILKVKTR